MKKFSKILVVASTKQEISEFEESLADNALANSNINSYKLYDLKVDILVCGIGVPQATYGLLKQLNKQKYDLVLNIGICGSFNEDLIVGDSVSIIMDEFADIGITHSDSLVKTLFEEELLKQNSFPFKNGKLYNSFSAKIDTDLPKVTGITVNVSSGTKEQIKFRKKKFNPDIETMEGAAIAYVCLLEKIDFLQIRAVSNMVEPRNTKKWDIDKAVKCLAESVMNVLLSLNIHK